MELLNILKDAVMNLSFPSEIDAPFEVVTWANSRNIEISPTAIFEHTGTKSVEYIEETNLESLFATPTMEQDWHSAEDTKKVKRFRFLKEAINNNLNNIKVYRCGKINIDVFIVGRTPSGNILCVSTKQLQT